MLGEISFGSLSDGRIFLFAAVLGAALGVLYDMFRVLRSVLPHGKAATFFEDVIYMLIFGLVLFIFSTALIGSVRYYSAAGMIVGWIIQRLTIGNAVVFIVRKILLFIRRKILSPVIGFITKIGRSIKGLFVKKCLNFKKNLKINKKCLKVEN